MQKPESNPWKKALQAFSMERFRIQLLIFFLTGFAVTNTARGQNADIDFVKAVNPEGEKSFFFRGLSSSVYPIGLSIPAGTFLYGEIKKDRCDKIHAFEEAGTILITGITAAGLKVVVDRKRPYESYAGVYPLQYEKGHSMPSAHAAIAFGTATSLALQYRKWYVVIPAYVWAAGCGFSRIYLGEHYPSDVLTGAAIGISGAFLSHWLANKIFRQCSVLKEPM